MARVRVFAGICGFTTNVEATSDDEQHVTLQVQSDCPDVIRLSKKLNGLTLDAYEEIGPCERDSSIYETRIMRLCGELPHPACPVPAGICKAMEIAARLALPRDAHIQVFAEAESGGSAEASEEDAPAAEES